MLAARTVVQAMQGRIVGASTDAAGRVYVGRGWPVDRFPAVRLVIVNEDFSSGDDEITWPRTQDHTLTVEARCLALDVDDPEAAADALALQVLLALEGTEAAARLEPLGGCVLTSTGINRSTQSEGEATLGVAAVTFDVLFSTSSNDPETLSS